MIAFHDAAGFSPRRPAPPTATRNQAEAEKLTQEVLEQIKNNADFSALVAKYSDDPKQPGKPQGVYSMTNTGAPPQQGAYSRSGMAKDFGNVSFSLEVGEIKVADYHPTTSPFGWHIIKRLE